MLPESKQLMIEGNDELTQVTVSMNQMLERIAGSHREIGQLNAALQAEAMVTLVFSAGADALDMSAEQLPQLAERLICQLRFVARGAALTASEPQP